MVANPANTNVLILKEFAPSIPERDITCLTRLDHNRALGQRSERLNVHVSDVKNVIIWGNHSSSSTQYPAVNHATVDNENGLKFVRELVGDDHWYLTILFSLIQIQILIHILPTFCPKALERKEPSFCLSFKENRP